MMDDVVGLVMVQVISNLGSDNFSWVTVVRPVLVSVAFAVVAPLVCFFVAKPLTTWLNAYRKAHPRARLSVLLQQKQTAFVIHTLVLVGLVTGATYAGTSNLFATYIAGASVSWWDSDVLHPLDVAATSAADEKSQAAVGAIIESSGGSSPETSMAQADRNPESTSSQPINTDKVEPLVATGGAAIYEHYYHPAVSKILQPFFFASIGFSIPITRMFRGAIVWRGIVYAVLMSFAKIVCGLWLVRFSISPSKKVASRVLSKVRLPSVPHLWGKRDGGTSAQVGATLSQTGATPSQAGATPSRTRPSTSSSSTESEARSSPNPPKPFSLHPPLILAFAMCARGEIGFLISGVAESQGVFGETSGEPTDIFLVVTWAIVLCTMLGPLAVGLSVRRVRALQARKNKHQEGAGRDVLGVWGVE
jgi:hypothetical protein